MNTSIEVLDQKQLIPTEGVEQLAFSDWIDSEREEHPELAQRLDLAQEHFRELVTLRAAMWKLEQERDAAIASVRDYLREHQELIEPLTQVMEKQAELDEQDADMAWHCYQEVIVDEIVARATEIIEIDKRLGYMGETTHEDLNVMEGVQESFFVWLDLGGDATRPLFEYQDGVVTLNEMTPQYIAKLKQLHEKAIAWEANFENWKAEQKAKSQA